jgi:cell wall assembly regulator SMI1
MPSHGRFTIDLGTGGVLASELVADSGSLRAQIDVAYSFEPAMGMLVPREMREKYSLKDGSKIDGKATYAKFRRYQVVVNETIK